MLGNVFRLGKNLFTSGAIQRELASAQKPLTPSWEKIIDEGIKHAPDLRRYGKERVTNKTLKKGLESDNKAEEAVLHFSERTAKVF